jgi:uncharacterized protein
MAHEPKGHVFFSGDERLEGILEWPAGSGAGHGDGHVAGGVVVAHPHPLMGGTMAQPVVYRVAQACRGEGFATLRFNFRGVERSGGEHTGLDEHRDVEAAVAFMQDRLGAEGARRPRLGLAGYSFGSIQSAIAAGSGRIAVDALALIALVVHWQKLPLPAPDALAAFKGPVLALCAELDELAAPATVERELQRLGVDFRLVVLEGTGHFFEQRQRDVGEQVAAFFAETLGAKRPATGEPER